MKPSDSLLRHGSDKVTTHRYGPLYDSIFRIGEIRTVIEVGVQEGHSLRAWAECVGEGGIVYGMDVDPEPAILSNQCRFARVDATDPDAVLQAINLWDIAAGSIDLIVDDGSHLFKDQLATHALLWDFVAAGGWYVVEDINPQTPFAPFFRLGGVLCDYRQRSNRFDDIAFLFRKPG